MNIFRNNFNFPLFIFLCLSGNPLFTSTPYSKLLLILIVLSFSIFIASKSQIRFSKKTLFLFSIVVLFFIFLNFLQFLSFGFVSYLGTGSLILKLLFAFLILTYFNYKQVSIEDVYIKMLSKIVLISLPFYVINFFYFVGIPTNLTNRKSIFIYTFLEHADELVRNSGMFWEPGAFAGYLLIAIIFIFKQNKSFSIKNYKIEFYTILLGLISTQSTTGYFVLSIMLLFYIFNIKSIFKYFLLPFFIFGIIIVLEKAPFLLEKVVFQFVEASELENFQISNTRFGSLKMDFDYMKSSPIWGNGVHVGSRYRFHPWVKEDIGHGNGMSNFIASWGFPVFIFWLHQLFIYFKKSFLTNSKSFVFVFIILLILQGEQFLDYPLFLMFFFMPFFKKRNYQI